VNGLLPQVEMTLLGGNVPLTASATSVTLILLFGCGLVLRPSVSLQNFPVRFWVVCLVFLLFEVPYLQTQGMKFQEVLGSYNEYYFLLMCAPAVLIYRGTLSERGLLWPVYALLVLCAVVGIAQYGFSQPILRTESVNGLYSVSSWEFMGGIRAFSFFTSSLVFGLFCSFCGALGVARLRRSRIVGTLLIVISGAACFATLTRLTYLVYLCAITYATVLVFGRKPRRGLLLPVLFFFLGVSTILVGMLSLFGDSAGKLQDAGTLMERAEEAQFYGGKIVDASWTERLFGLAILTDKDKNPIPIDNVPLAIMLHTGLIGMFLLGALMIQFWLYLRREAIENQHPMVIAAASLCSTLPCGGLFNVVMMQFGIVCALALFASEKRQPDTTLRLIS
jgi:hypothetical protein